ncbi:MAG: L,D-transpeptidase family protein [Armatimonadetes bacterium]|nr:DUF2778 domain-containing protein [Armatimonadota bacterium]NOG39754.1 L,D-transpeptidase family protein [Armatimonadota bacterium]
MDDADKLIIITQGGNTVKSFTYDAAGRTTAVTVGNDTTSVAYDYESRITQITYPNQNTNSFAYNGLDTRVSKVDSTGTRTYLRDGAYVTDPVLSDGAALYTPGISERRSSVTKFFHPDRLGTTGRLTDTNQSTTDTRQYDAFGLLTNSSGSTPTPFGFAGAWGYQEDPDSGLKLLGHRYYDPSTGRFLTRDPVKDGRNWYGYCAGNPQVLLDVAGLDTLIFNGRKLKHYSSDGKLIGTYPARSGMPGSTVSDQDKKNVGPIPEGSYYIKKWQVQRESYWPGDWWRDEFYPGGTNFGERRVPLYACPETETYGRDGFFVHGGSRPQTAGCIQVDGAVELLDRIQSGEDRVVKVTVIYEKKG